MKSQFPVVTCIYAFLGTFAGMAAGASLALLVGLRPTGNGSLMPFVVLGGLGGNILAQSFYSRLSAR